MGKTREYFDAVEEIQRELERHEKEAKSHEHNGRSGYRNYCEMMAFRDGMLYALELMGIDVLDLGLEYCFTEPLQPAAPACPECGTEQIQGDDEIDGLPYWYCGACQVTAEDAQADNWRKQQTTD